MNICNDCQNEITDGFSSLEDMTKTKAESTWLGVYYDGPLICDSCCNKRYERAMTESDQLQRDRS